MALARAIDLGAVFVRGPSFTLPDIELFGDGGPPTEGQRPAMLMRNLSAAPRRLRVDRVSDPLFRHHGRAALAWRDDLAGVFRRRSREPRPEARRETSRDSKIESRDIINLPQLYSDMRDRGQRGITWRKDTRVKVDQTAFGERIACSGAGEAKDCTSIGLIGYGGEAAEFPLGDLHNIAPPAHKEPTAGAGPNEIGVIP